LFGLIDINRRKRAPARIALVVACIRLLTEIKKQGLPLPSLTSAARLWSAAPTL